MGKKITVVIAALVVTASFICADLFAKEYKLGYVDLGKVFDEYKKTKESEKVMEERAKAKEAERKKLVDDIRKLKDEQALLSDKAKSEKQALIDDKIKSLQDFDRNTRDALMKERNDTLNGILKDIEKVITDYSKESGYDFVFNSRMLLFGKEEYDFTGEILKRLNK